MKVHGINARPSAAGAGREGAVRVLSRQKLFYDEGPRPEQDRPAHVRAGSGCCFVDVPGRGRRLAVVQDDASFIAMVDPRTGSVDGIELWRGPGGRRQFDQGRGNKMDKLDLESIAAVIVDGRPALLAMGSGSARPREVFVLVRFEDAGPVVEQLAAGAFFSALRRERAFAGDELNVEGLVVDGDRVRFFNRGNGAGEARDAVCDVSFSALLSHLRDPLLHAPPPPRNVAAFDLGSVAGTRLALTDATKHPDGRTLFLAAAERSPNAVDDGEVVGCAIGVLDDDATTILPLLDERGAPLTDKVEGLAVDPLDPQKVWVVVDKDDPSAPAELLQVRLP